MKSRKIRILAWPLCAVAVGGGIVHLIVRITYLAGSPTFSEAANGLALGLMIPLVFPVLAALIIARQPSNRVGWLMMIVGLALNNPASVFLETLSGPPAAMTPGLWLLLWLDGWSWIPVIFPVLLIPLFFPTGKPPSPRWRWVGWLDGPLFSAVWGLGLVTIVLGSVASLFVRYRRAGTDERRQIKWLLFAAAFLAVFYTLSVFLPDPAYGTAWWGLLFVFAILCIPIAITVAIFRYRLWDLEVVVNRALI